VTKISDFYSSRQWRATGMYRDHLRWVEHEIMVCLPGGPGQSVRLVFFRSSGPDFSERDRALLTLLRPHLHEAFLDAERRRHGIPDLTARQWDLLRLAAAGATNAQIARRLGISEGTVRTHMENIFARLQVSSRAAAITRAFPDRATLMGADLTAIGQSSFISPAVRLGPMETPSKTLPTRARM
jgi:DNA-binding CsgD family transcriptional regulator